MNKSFVYWLFFFTLLLVATAVIAITSTLRSNSAQLQESVAAQQLQALEQVLEEFVEITRQPQRPLISPFFSQWY